MVAFFVIHGTVLVDGLELRVHEIEVRLEEERLMKSICGDV